MPEAQLTTDRLILRRWRDTDLAPFRALNADPLVMEFLGAPLSGEASNDMARRIDAEFDERGFGLFATELAATNEFIGFIGLHVPSFESHFTPCVEIGWRLSVDSWGRGLATEGAHAVRVNAHQELKIPEIVSMTALINRRSQRVMEKIGLTRDPRDDFVHPGETVPEQLRAHVLYRGRVPGTT